MPRNKVKSIRLTARISENTSSLEDVEFVERKLKEGFSQAVIIRQAIKIYRKYEEGAFFKEASSKMDTNNVNTANNDNNRINGLNEKLQSGDFL
ncbi:hypothetical protein [Fuchsiella alkaliacetigena]|uniref:hypothetical protein n=1 Tax=Fuchsiella alkaliacetigena TaxID=957042 RepID=UPI00200A1C03|nr:hypothetical protein [Fuchsiella alkaliacetigena]MCK8825498.1 hypothetical protein [Fuchsiella alkaliacetigena]